MDCKPNIAGMTRTTYHGVIDLAFATLRIDDPKNYSRQRAIDFVINEGKNKVIVMTCENKVVGTYIYSEGPNGYSLLLFALDNSIKKTKSAYKLYLDMKERLVSKPVLFSVYGESTDMQLLVSKRSKLLGVSKSRGNKTISYYSIMFNDKKIWGD